MAEPAESENQNLLPVQAYFSVDGEFQTFIGQGQPFYATVDPDQSGLNITNSTINSSTIGATTPSTGVFTNVSTTTGTIATAPSANTDITNKAYVDAVAQGLNPKGAVKCATTANITLSGLQTIDGYTTLAGDRVLVKNESSAPTNGIYIAGSGAWTRAVDMDVWAEVPGAYCVVLNGTQNGNTAWVSTSSDAGTINVTPITFVQFAGTGTYYAGTGLSLSANTFSITNTGVTATTYGSASSVPVLAVNAQGQITSASSSAIAIANTQVSGLGTMSTQNANSVAITGGTIDGATIGGTTAGAVTGTTITANTQFTGSGAGLTGTAASLSIGGNAATATSATSATSATTATNLAGGAAGSVPYQASSGSTSMLAAGSNGQVLTLASGVPSWATPTVGTVTSVSGTGTVSGISLSGTVTTSGDLTLGGTLDLSAPPAIGGTTANTVRGTTITATTKFVGPFFDAANSAGGALRNASGVAQIQWGSGGGSNVSVDVSTNLNGSNAQIDISPTGTGHVHMKPSGTGSVEIAPTNAGTLDNLVIGGVTPLAGTFTTLRLNTTLSVNGSTGSSGQVLTSSGSGLPTWSTPTAYATVTDDTTTNATRYPLFSDATSGNLTTEYTSSTKYQFNPSTGVLTATSFSGAGAFTTLSASSTVSGTGFSTYLASPPAIGGTAAAAGTFTTLTATADSAFTSTGALQLPVGTTAQQPTGAAGKLRFNSTTSQFEGYTGAAWASVGGAAITDDTTTNSTFYPLFASTTSGTATTVYTSSTKYKYNPSTGTLSAPQVAASNGILVNSQTVAANYTIATGDNGLSAGPVTVSSGITVTIASGSVWTVV